MTHPFDSPFRDSFDERRYPTLVDRKKNMNISGGENVYSVEVESVLSTHPDVLEVAVIGVSGEKWGEAVKAIIVPRPGAVAAPSGRVAARRLTFR